MNQALQTDLDFRLVFSLARKMARRYGTIGIYQPDDVAHNAMIRFLSRAGDRQPTTGWLYKTVRSAAADLMRSVARERDFVAASDGSTGSVCELADELGMVYLNRRHGSGQEQPFENIPILRSMLQQLTEPLREVLLLYASGKSYEEIADATGAKVGTVRSRLHYARRRAKKLLAGLL